MRFSFPILALYISIFKLITLFTDFEQKNFLFNTLESLDILQMNHSKQHEWLTGNVEKVVYVIKMIYVNEIEILHALVINVKPMPD